MKKLEEIEKKHLVKDQKQEKKPQDNGSDTEEDEDLTKKASKIIEKKKSGVLFPKETKEEKEYVGESDEENEPEAQVIILFIEKNQSLEEKRKLYKCGKRFKVLADMDTIVELAKELPIPIKLPPHKPNNALASKISLIKADITSLEIDAIVNAAKPSLQGGGGVDGAIHKAAGPGLVKECLTIEGGCSIGEAKITGGHRLPAKYVVIFSHLFTQFYFRSTQSVPLEKTVPCSKVAIKNL